MSTTSAIKYCSYCMKHKQISKIMIINSVHMEVLEGQVRDPTLSVIPPVYNYKDLLKTQRHSFIQ